jgi:hypothetical protein
VAFVLTREVVGVFVRFSCAAIKIWGIDTYGSVFKNTMKQEF